MLVLSAIGGDLVMLALSAGKRDLLSKLMARAESLRVAPAGKDDF